VNYLRESVFRFSVLLSVVKTAAYQLIWIFSIVVAPMIYFGLDGTLGFKIIFFVSAFLLILFFYVMLCFVLFRLSLNNKESLKGYLSLSDQDKGKKIGTVLAGW